MGFDWKAIESYEDSEVGLYRLIGEMLQRKATPDDLESIRAFLLSAHGPASDAWRSIGEALYRTTSGSDSGYQIWTDWLETLPDIDHQREALSDDWVNFGDELSEAAEIPDPIADVPARFQHGDPDEDFAAEDTSTGVMSAPQLQVAATGVLAESATALLRMVPSGPYTLRIFGREYRQVDEYTILALIKRGLFLGAHIQFGNGWLPAWEHPAFERIAGRLDAEAQRILSRAQMVTDEATRPQ